MLAAATVLAFSFITQAFAHNGCTRTYTVQQGDICDDISYKHNVSTFQLSATNDFINEDCSNLEPGKELCLGLPGQDCTVTYKVVLNDTYEDIATKHNINSTILRKNNPQLQEDGKNLYVGEIICVADTVVVPPMPSDKVPAHSIPVTASAADPSLSGKPGSPTTTPDSSKNSGPPFNVPATTTSTSYKTVSPTPGAPVVSSPNASPASSGTGAPSPPGTESPSPSPSPDGNTDDDSHLPFCD